jgi:SAM-dependent methyltransferase
MGELLIGCGNSREKRLYVDQPEWTALTTLDINPDCGADIEWDLERLPLPFEDNSFDALHAYDVLEHTGRQGDFRFFFAQFEDFWRILKPGGHLCGIIPAHGTIWTWGDPGHTRVINRGTLTFLVQPEYGRQIGKTPLTDYRRFYRADFEPTLIDESEERLAFVLTAVKPARLS